MLLFGCSATKHKQSEDHENATNLPSPKLEVIADNLQTPWSIQKSGDAFYLTERPGNIVKITDREVERQHVELSKELSTASEAGLLGFVLAPDFLESKRAYAYYTYVDDTNQFNRIITLTLQDNKWKEERLLIDRINSSSYHHGGRLKIGPDGKLYATIGDATQPTLAQDLSVLEGKILRLNLDGTIPSDNPFPNSYVYSFGHRNPQGLAWALDGKMYASEHGNSANDEINEIEKGQNYGWPIIEGTEEQQGMVAPLFTSGNNNTWAPSGIDYDKGKLYVAALRGAAVLEFNVETNEQRELVSDLGRIRDIFVDDKFLYFISNNTDGRGNPRTNDDKLYRIPL
ncbi:sorbosone dehydrogenase family protein [Lysinibacillus agricola]|uniref:Sorbosone dehydrogenase family protein n=2 Tax=Bacillaceae TaxID=186817 RepID=A0ABX7AYN0_9BACI|nr:sorbosone dehydrogenase family protein [Lysinibacillus agricola]